MENYEAAVRRYIELEIETLKKLDTASISALMKALEQARLRGGNIYIMGNGGSAATASHFFNDFNKGLSEHLEKPYNFICLNDNIATIMAVANDISYEAVFEFQLRRRVCPNDLVIGISGSGNSKNVLNAIERAKAAGAATAGLTGYDGGKLAKMVDISVNVPVMSMQVTEDVHMVIDHMIAAVFYELLCGIDHVRTEK